MPEQRKAGGGASQDDPATNPSPGGSSDPAHHLAVRAVGKRSRHGWADDSAPRAPPRKRPDDTDSSSDFELKPMGDSSSPLEPSSDELPRPDGR